MKAILLTVIALSGGSAWAMQATSWPSPADLESCKGMSTRLSKSGTPLIVVFGGESRKICFPRLIGAPIRSSTGIRAIDIGRDFLGWRRQLTAPLAEGDKLSAEYFEAYAAILRAASACMQVGEFGDAVKPFIDCEGKAATDFMKVIGQAAAVDVKLSALEKGTSVLLLKAPRFNLVVHGPDGSFRVEADEAAKKLGLSVLACWADPKKPRCELSLQPRAEKANSAGNQINWPTMGLGRRGWRTGPQVNDADPTHEIETPSKIDPAAKKPVELGAPKGK